MQISDIFLLLSFHEGLTLSIIEAMHFGLPVVCSDVRGNKDLIENEKGGFVVPTTDHIKTAQKLSYLLDNPDVCEKMGKLNKENSKQYSIENVINELDVIYDTINFDKNKKNKK
jgi:glycosyltransferase EpsD